MNNPKIRYIESTDRLNTKVIKIVEYDQDPILYITTFYKSSEMHVKKADLEEALKKTA